jgi:hypothetical protein
MDTYSSSTQRLFIGTCLVMVALMVAFPVSQAFKTGGYVFFTNGIDEASYLSYPFSKLLLTWQGITRYSSALVVLLHTMGLSGGYCNVVLDLICVIAFLFATRRALSRFGLDSESAAVGALLIFVLPLFFTPWNPLLLGVKRYLLLSPLFQWVTVAPNDELLFLRSPEPQLSWTLIAIVFAYAPTARAIPWLLLLVSPFLYSFVRLPLIFSCLTVVVPRAIPLVVRMILAFLLSGILVAAFVEYSISVDLRRFVIASRAPVLSLSALVATVLWLVARRRVPAQWRELLSVLVASTWVGANTQIISGWMVCPSNYDEYWSGVVTALISAVLIVVSSHHKRCWVVVVVCAMALHSLQTFDRNESIMARLHDPTKAMQLLREAPESVAFDDILLATTADLVHPRQGHTLLSFSRTYEISSPADLQSYLCAKRAIREYGYGLASKYTSIFEHLDWGYQHRGVDEIVTLRRRPLEVTAMSLSVSNLQCEETPPVVLLGEEASAKPE